MAKKTDKKTNEDTNSPFGSLPFPNLFTQWTSQSTEQLNAAVDQWEQFEQKSATRAEGAADEMTKLIRASFDYSLELNTKLQKQAIENTRKMLQMMAT